MSVEDISLMRSLENYSTDIDIDNFKETGIYRKAILNTINSFHVTNNYCIDIMHDLFEGVSLYNIIVPYN